jgi:hypothetical protein
MLSYVICERRFSYHSPVTFFTFSAPRTISGSQKDFGGFLLNPPGQGTSFYVSASKAWQSPLPDLLIGIAGRTGITQSNFEATVAGTKQTLSAFAGYFTPSLLIATKTYQAKTDGDMATPNEYQVGLESVPLFVC